jgi:hypothetical protein
LTPGGAALVADTPGLGITLSGSEPLVSAPDPEALGALERVDPWHVRWIEFASGAAAAALWADAAAREAAA